MTSTGPLPQDERKPESLTQRSVGAALWTTSGTAAKLLLKLAVLAVLARLVEPIEFGWMAAALIVIEFFEIFVRVGVGPVVVQRRELTDGHVGAAFLLSTALAVALAGAMAGAAGLIAMGLFRAPELAGVLRAACLVLPLHAIAVVPLALLQRDLQFRKIVTIETVGYAIGFAGVGIVLATRGLGVWALVGAHLAEALLVCVLALVARPLPRRLLPDRQALHETAVVGGGFALARAANYFALNGDKWVIGRWLGAASLGLYKYAFELATLPGNVLGQVLDRVLFPALARVQDEPARLARAYRSGLALVACVVLPISGAMIVLAEEIVLTVLGPKWIAIVEPLRILAAVAVLRSGLKVADALARATGAVYRRAWRQAIYAAAILTGAIVGSRSGLPGAAGGVAIGVLVGWLLMGDLGRSLTGVRGAELLGVNLRALPLAAVTVGFAITVRSAAASLSLPAPAVLVAAAIGSAAGAGALALLFPRLLLGRDALSGLRSVLGSARRSRVLRRLVDAAPAPGSARA